MGRKKELTPNEARKKRAGLCIASYCTKKAPKGRHMCYACARRDWAERNPEHYLFCNLRGNARRRGKEFGISLDEFKEFLEKENYLRRKRGRTKTSVSIDRPDNTRGYFADNMGTLTLKANAEKMHYVDYFRRQYEQASA